MVGEETYALSLAAILEPWSAVTLQLSFVPYGTKASYVDLIHRPTLPDVGCLLPESGLLLLLQEPV